MEIKSEIIRLTKKCHEIWPGKHISIHPGSNLYGHENTGKVHWDYDLYVEDTIKHEIFQSLAGVRAAIEAKQIDMRGE